MLNGAMYWSGQHVCHMLTNVVSAQAFSACVDHEQVVGTILVMWAALLIVYWRLFAKSH